MTLEEKIKSIDIVDADSRLIPMETSSKIKIKDFWTDFIAPHLPDPDVVKAWSRLLIDYTKEDDAVFAIRAFYGWEMNYRETKKDDELRRGFLTVPSNAPYTYFFTDNSFAVYFHKMALDGYVPSLSELKDMMQKRAFPAHFGRSCGAERDKAAYTIGATPVPPIGEYGYKIAHVSDACGHYSLNGKDDLSFSDMAPSHFPRGKYSDWTYDASLGCYARTLDVSPKTRQIIIAHFLRFVNPFNHFLVPKAKYTYRSKKTGEKITKIYNQYFNYINGETKYDIGEFKPLLDYVNERFEKDIYKDEYIEYRKMLLLPEGFFGTVSGDEEINIEYGNPLLTFVNGKGVTSTALASSTVHKAPKTTIDLTGISKIYLDGFKVGEIANQVLRAIIISGVNSGKITKADIDVFKTEKGKRTSTFMISKPLLALVREDSSGRPRYYEAPIACYGETLYLYKDWDKNDTEIKDNMIQWILNWIAANGGKI